MTSAQSAPLAGKFPNHAIGKVEAEKGLIVFFMRDFGCHVCVGHAIELNKAAPEFATKGFAVVVVGPGSEKAAEKLKARYKLDVPVIADESHEVYDRLGLDKAMAFLQKSGTFVFDSKGEPALARRSAMPTGALDLAELRRQIEALA